MDKEEPGVRGGEDGCMLRMGGGRLILGGSRSRRIFLGVWRLEREGGLLGERGGRKGISNGAGRIGLLRGRGCE